jgi:hypothetical protein
MDRINAVLEAHKISEKLGPDYALFNADLIKAMTPVVNPPPTLPIITTTSTTCTASTTKGTTCTRAKTDNSQFCKQHLKKSTEGATKSAAAKTKTADTTTKHKCAGKLKNNEECGTMTTNKPEGAKKYYCYRHTKKWATYE